MRQLDPRVVSAADHKAHFTDSMQSLLNTATKHFSASHSSPVIVATIPPITEDLSSPLNDLAREYNQQLHQLVQQHAHNVALVDFYAACHETIAAAQRMAQQHCPQQQAPSPFSVSVSSTMALLQRWLQGKSWDAITQERGFCLLVDGVHFNEKGAALLVQAVAPKLASVLQDEAVLLS